ncbi:MAG: hypothetical protein HQL37_01075 [Alphaproteobacteria bacterium]|nr:hypothetical protein [Alphaproteobacteria bacterium]
MTYNVQIRHSRPVPYGDGNEYQRESRRIEAQTEEEAILKIRLTPLDNIDCVDSWHHEGMFPFSVDTGNPDFFTNVTRPSLERIGLEPRVG